MSAETISRINLDVPQHQKVYRILPTEKYIAKMNQGVDGKGAEGPFCGDYEGTHSYEEGLRYFVFDDRSPHTYLFIDLGFDPPMFDPASLFY